MKKLFYSFALLALLVGCSDEPAPDKGKDEPEPEPTPTEEIYRATFEKSESNPTWSHGDAITIFRTIANEKFAYNSEADGFKKADNTAQTKKLNYVYGVFPYSENNSISIANDISLRVASRQNYVEGSFDAAQAPMLAASAKDSKELVFKNLCGFVSVKLYGAAVIKEIALEGANGEKLAGNAITSIATDGAPAIASFESAETSVSLNLGNGFELNEAEEDATTFTFFVAPQTFSKGLYVIVTDSEGNNHRKTFSGEIIVERNKTTTLEKSCEISTDIVAQLILDVKFNADGTATDEGIFGLNIETIKTADGKTPHLQVYSHPEFPLNNVASFSHIACNGNVATVNHSFYYLDFSREEEFKAALADGFTMEVVTLTPTTNWDWWVKAVSTETFGIFRKGDRDNSAWCYGFNHGGDWFPGSHFSTDTTAEIGKYTHSTFVYDFNNQVVQAYINGEWMAERPGISTFDIGTRFAIGGFPTADKKLTTQWNGEVALVRIYDQPLTEEEIMNTYYELNLPEASAAPEAAPISEPLLDLQWADDKSATNVGSQTSLKVTSVPSEATQIININGFGNILNTNHTVNNFDFDSGFYRVDYTNDADFKSKLQDGFTMELVCIANGNPGDYYVRPLSTDTWGCMLWCPYQGPYHCWRPFANADNESWTHMGQNIDGYRVFELETGKVMDSFAHLMYVYNAEAKDWYLYYDGKFCGGLPQPDFKVGNILNINGMPYNDLKAVHGFNGKFALARIYDEAFTQQQILTRYAELQPTIQTLNAAIQ